MNILFICKGNVGRSQIAEALYKKKFGDRDTVISAGMTYPGPEMPLSALLPRVQEVLDVIKEEGIEASEWIRKPLTKRMIDDADKIIVILEDKDILTPNLIGLSKVTRWSVLDPKGQDINFAREVKNKIKALIESL